MRHTIKVYDITINKMANKMKMNKMKMKNQASGIVPYSMIILEP